MKNFVLIPIKHKKENKHHRGIFVLKKVILADIRKLKKRTPEEIIFYKDCHMSKTGVIQSSVRH